MMNVRRAGGAAALSRMDGRLSDHPLAELINEISDARLSGALRLARERVKGVVYFRDGSVVAALMNLRATRLTEILRRSGAADPARLSALLPEGTTDEQAALVVVRAGLVAESDLAKLQARQSTEVLRELLRWADGEWAFQPNVRPAGEFRVQLNITQLLVESARTLAPEAVSQRLADDGETLKLSDSAATLLEGGVQLLPSEAFVMTRVYGPTPLGEVVALSGLQEDDARRAVYALLLGGLLERGERRHALSPELVKQAKARADQSPATDAPSAEAQKKTDAEEAAPSSTITAEADADPASAVEELFAHASGATHYEVLRVARSAPADEIKRAYYSLARRFHPDRFRRDADEELRQRIDAAFAKIAQAYETLKDSSHRSTYDLKLARQAPAARPPTPPAPSPTTTTKSEPPKPPSQAPRAERTDAKQERKAPPADAATEQEIPAHERAENNFREGLAALGRGDFSRARSHFGEAAAAVPLQARYRAYYGRSLAHDKGLRRQAESELQAAIGLDPNNTLYRIMLAELYTEVGLRRKAVAELERALSVNPTDARVRGMLEELRGA